MFGSKRALYGFRLQRGTTEKGRQPQIAAWYHQKGRRTLPKARAPDWGGEKVAGAWPERYLEGRRRQKSPKRGEAGGGGRVAGKGLTRPHAPAREMQSPTGKLRVAGAWMSFWFRCLHKSWRSPPGAPSGMVGVGKIRRRKVCRKIFAGGECFLTTIRLIGKYWEMGKVTGMKHGHRKVPRNRYWGLHPPPAPLEDVVDDGLKAIQRAIFLRKAGVETPFEYNSLCLICYRYLQVSRRRDLTLSVREGVDTLLMYLYRALNSVDDMEKLASSENSCIVRNLSIPMHCKTERLLSEACLKDDRTTCMGGAGGKLSSGLWKDPAVESELLDTNASTLSGKEAVAIEATKILEESSDQDLVLQHLGWIADVCQVLAVRVLTSERRADQLSPGRHHVLPTFLSSIMLYSAAICFMQCKCYHLLAIKSRPHDPHVWLKELVKWLDKRVAVKVALWSWVMDVVTLQKTKLENLDKMAMDNPCYLMSNQEISW
ncbi:hypothetical protein CK203_039736 [Vitis vinifera]|uniref:Uncharacterized protein n=1 Tax=Vitis vinifera TaxID=29760 RepID=A0A438HTM9_VITVI|nr:hypothetical protein CK203_039736 [Vitis vinifera]